MSAVSLSLSVERRNRWATRIVSLLGAIPLLITALLLAFGLPTDELRVGMVVLLFVAYLMTAPLLVFVPWFVEWAIRRRLTAPGHDRRLGLTCEVDERSLWVRGFGGRKIELPRRTLALAWTPQPNVVEVMTRDGTEGHFQFWSPSDATALLTELRRAAIHSRAYTIPTERPAQRVARKLFGTVVPLSLAALLAPFGAPTVLLGLGAAALVAWVIASGTPRVEFGADGLMLQGRFRQGYVRYREIADTQLNRLFMGGSASVRLVLHTGEEVALPGSFLDFNRARLLKALVDEGREMTASGLRAGAEVAQLARGTEDDADWIDRVSHAGHQAGYRGAALGADRLDSLMRNPAADPEQRVAAALALRVEPDGPARIQAAAEASTEPEVKDIFEVLASGELSRDELDGAVRRLSRPGLKRAGK